MIVVLFSAALGAGILSLVICHPLWPSRSTGAAAARELGKGVSDFFSRCRPAPSSADFNCLTLYCLLGSCLSFHVFTRCVLVVLRYAGVSPRFDVAVCFLQLMELWLLCTCFAPLGFSMPLSRRRGRGGKGLVNCPGIVAPE